MDVCYLFVYVTMLLEIRTKLRQFFFVSAPASRIRFDIDMGLSAVAGTD